MLKAGVLGQTRFTADNYTAPVVVYQVPTNAIYAEVIIHVGQGGAVHVETTTGAYVSLSGDVATDSVGGPMATVLNTGRVVKNIILGPGEKVVASGNLCIKPGSYGWVSVFGIEHN